MNFKSNLKILKKTEIDQNRFKKIICEGSVRINNILVFEDTFLTPGSKVLTYLEPKIYQSDVNIVGIHIENYKINSDLQWNLLRWITSNWLIVDKPAGISTMPTRDFASGSLIPHWLRKNLPRTLNSSSLLLTSRLDVGTHGLIVVARNENYATIHNQNIRNRKVTKKYTTVVSGWSLVGDGTEKQNYYRYCGIWNHWIPKKGIIKTEIEQIKLGETHETVVENYDSEHLKVVASRQLNPGIQDINVQLIIESFRIAKEDSVALRPFDKDWIKELIKKCHEDSNPLYELDIELLTGKTHQIRSQLKCEGLEIIGDWLYGSFSNSKPNTFALCCRQLSWLCPIEKKQITYDLRENKI